MLTANVNSLVVTHVTGLVLLPMTRRKILLGRGML